MQYFFNILIKSILFGALMTVIIGITYVLSNSNGAEKEYIEKYLFIVFSLSFMIYLVFGIIRYLK